MKIAILMLLGFAMSTISCSAATQTKASKPVTKEEMRSAIKDILAATFEQAARRKSDGSVDFINVSLMHVKDENRKRVRDFGTAAIGVLREYTTDDQGWRQQLALEWLGEFKSDEALAALIDFAEHSKVRDIAVTDMSSYPIDKTRPILKRFLSDPDPLIHDAAKRALSANGEKWTIRQTGGETKPWSYKASAAPSGLAV